MTFSACVAACLVSTFASLVACGQSPILHHHTEREVERARKVGDVGDALLKFPQHGLVARLSWKTGPDTKGESVAMLSFLSLSTAEPVELTEDVAVTLWMPSMGHGSSPTRVTRARQAAGGIQSGVYVVANCFFIMPGAWEVQVSVGTETATVNVDL